MKKRGLIPIAIGAAAAIAGAAAWAWRRFGPATYVRFDTMFGTARVYHVADDDGEQVRLLEVNGIVQSGTYLGERYTELVFEYLKRYDLMFASGHPVHRVCVLGCGGYDYPEHLIADHEDVTVDAVEIDPAITAIAQRYFFLDRLVEEYDTETTGRLNLVCADAFDYLKETDKRYDAIVNDAFDGGTPPAQLTTSEFAQLVKEHLEPGGLYLTNIVAPLSGAGAVFLHEQVGILQEAFGNARVIPCDSDSLADEDNVVVVARRSRHGKLSS